VYIGKLGNGYFYQGEIAGQTDFLYGFGTAWIQNSTLSLRGSGYIAAWKGNNGTVRNKYGVYIHKSQVGKSKTTKTANMEHSVALGRPWVCFLMAYHLINRFQLIKRQNELHRSIFANCFLDDSIRPEGYVTWDKSSSRVDARTMMAEYNNRSVKG
jgi:pectin methylesterase-like acyl-CoA thioesterase